MAQRHLEQVVLINRRTSFEPTLEINLPLQRTIETCHSIQHLNLSRCEGDRKERRLQAINLSLP
jgi:hypothetical protein